MECRRRGPELQRRPPDHARRDLIVQMSIEEDGNSLEGTPPEVFATRLAEWNADVVGLNCSVGPQIMLDAIRSCRCRLRKTATVWRARRPRFSPRDSRNGMPTSWA